MLRKLTVPMLAGLMLLFAIYHVVKAQQTPPSSAPAVEPRRAPFSKNLAASGVVEATTENISIGSPLPGVVREVAARVGARVKRGDPLFYLDDRHLQAELSMRQANLAAAQAQLTRLDSMPRPEELPAAEAKVREARATLGSWTDQFERAQRMYDAQAVGEEELIKLRQSRQAAQEQYDRANADLSLLRAGAWEPDKIIARANVAQMQAQVTMTETEIDRLSIKAPIDGELLQVNVRPGEYVGTPPSQPLVVLGNIDQLHVRVEIDENDIHRFQKDAAADASLRGDPHQRFPLRFVRVEPLVMPKKTLSGVNTERVDTRILQVIYAIDPSAPQLYVGQQLDVYLQASR